jgi:hypothetical protein
MIELSKEQMQVLSHIDFTSEENQWLLATDDSIRFNEIKDVLGIHQEQLSRILKKLINEKLITKSNLPQWLAKLSKQQLEYYYQSHEFIGKPTMNKPTFYWITPLGEKLIKEKLEEQIRLRKKEDTGLGFIDYF